MTDIAERLDALELAILSLAARVYDRVMTSLEMPEGFPVATIESRMTVSLGEIQRAVKTALSKLSALTCRIPTPGRRA